MKQTILILVTVLLSTVGFSQNRDDHHEKIKTLKVAYITEKLNLTQTEAQNFWPIYNKFEEDHNKLRNDVSDKRKDIDMENLTESNAKSLIKEMELLYEKRYQSYQKYMKDLQTVLPAKKVVLLKKVEDDFKRKMFEEYKNRHGKSKNTP
ncbi:sensor of ECF-type sigma factor [Bizionia algoritergicola]|uniref:Sensor of ECF-type sigma factor n=1 Tax=Bizionia algoritergicola TaxID=291187 RepID=A0A5D0QNN2_9FLAO|nr:sensor of ECF-type sigma factor [Bizionia algoritergicola]TYB70797.1 sensor of ECF-type sigma factor [Bizionia algoritergicola]